jgi:hypothetical protein
MTRTGLGDPAGAASPAYDVERQRHVGALAARLPSEIDKMTWPLERLHAARDQRLRALVRAAKQRSPWHARRLRHVDPERLCGNEYNEAPRPRPAGSDRPFEEAAGGDYIARRRYIRIDDLTASVDGSILVQPFTDLGVAEAAAHLPADSPGR